ncbi:hypothetical protein [Kitasatospora sp. GAS204B]|uniref:hypothetical protein n=1 Tax=unclassified Kitasatospora TaxID=2633591 RepID=UPI00247438CC|nr:hypothetical protein [Kitasatospora sp. GAS204B]
MEPAGPAGRRRRAVVRADRACGVIDFDPVLRCDERPMGRNCHRVTIEAPGTVLERILVDSPLTTAIGDAISQLRAAPGPAPLDLAPLERIARIAHRLRPALRP